MLIYLVSGPAEADPEYQVIVDANNIIVEVDNEISEYSCLHYCPSNKPCKLSINAHRFQQLVQLHLLGGDDLDLTFDLAVVTLTFKILSGLYLRNCKIQKVDTL